MRSSDGKPAIFIFVSDTGDASNFFNNASKHGTSFIHHRGTETQSHREGKRSKPCQSKIKISISLCLCASVVTVLFNLHKDLSNIPRRRNLRRSDAGVGTSRMGHRRYSRIQRLRLAGSSLCLREFWVSNRKKLCPR